MNRTRCICLAWLLVSWGPTPHARGQYLEESTIQQAATVLAETISTPGHQIPQAMLADAQGVAIIPNVLKGGFVIGARHGRGLLFVRDRSGIWRAPVFITLTGGNIGWQVGVQSSDIILVFKTTKSVQGILNGKLTLGADAAAAAGPVGRQAAAATDGRLQAEIYTYSRSRGLFAGVSIDGSVIRVDQFATGTYYQSPGPGQPVVVPPSAQQLTESIATLAGATVVAAPNDAAIPHDSIIAEHHNASDADVLRQQLAQTSPELYELLDENWTRYLSLPSEVFLSGPHPGAQDLADTMVRFDGVATNPEFRQLAAQPEFQSVYGLLKHYQQSLIGQPRKLQLPPPPNSPSARR